MADGAEAIGRRLTQGADERAWLGVRAQDLDAQYHERHGGDESPDWIERALRVVLLQQDYLIRHIRRRAGTIDARG